MEILSLVDAGLAADGQVVSALGADHWHRPTPCDLIDVGAVVEHLVGALEQMADVAARRPFDPTAVPTLTPASAGDALQTAGARMVEGFGAPGALDAAYAMLFGATPGRDLVRFMVLEIVVHGWDIAGATDQSLPLADDAAEAALVVAHGFAPETLRAPGMLGAPVASDPGGPPLDRLAAFCGRRI